jgi:two-component system heavy metal sensor histidine kinase CusS
MFSRFAREQFGMRHWSLTIRISLFSCVAIAIIVMMASAIMYAELAHQLREKEEQELLAAMALQDDILADLRQHQVTSLFREEWSEQQEQRQQFAWRLLDGNGKVLSASAAPAASAMSPLPLASGQALGRFSLVKLRDAKHARYFLTRYVANAAVTGGMLQGALDVTRDEAVLERYRHGLLGVIAVAILLAAAAGALVAHHSLRPLREITAAIGAIDIERLELGIDQRAWPADLQTLARSFDGLLLRLQKSFEQLSRFSSDLAHEFRSPINNLVAAASVTLERERSAEGYRETLDVVVEEGNRLARMVSSMLFLARADNARHTLAAEPISVREMFDQLVEFYDPVAQEQQLTFQVHGDGQIVVDADLIRRALSNLLDNAVRHTGPGGSITLSATADASSVLVTVADDGEGIADSDLPFVFDRFYRGDSARSSTKRIGLGLSLVRSIVEMHGGSVSIDSAKGRGTRVVLALPRGLFALSRAT